MIGPPILDAGDDEEALALRAFVARALSQIDGRAVTAVISIPAPIAPLSVFLRAVSRDPSVLWSPAKDVSFAASGCAVRIMLSGRERFQQLRAGARLLWQRLATHDHPECSPAPPRLVGGLAFEPGGQGAYPWHEFSDGCFVLPRWTYERYEDRGVLRLAALGEQDRGLARHHELLAELDTILESLDAYEGQATNVASIRIPAIPDSAVHQLDFESWTAHIEKIRSAIQSGEYGKIVAARVCRVSLPRTMDDVDVLSRLSAEPGCMRFAFRGATSSFIGASPETLIAKRGTALATQALAGTIRSLGSEFPVLSRRSNQLLASDKDLMEHRFVVDEIRHRLEPFSAELDVPAMPGVSKIRNILHLNTPISARLREGVDPIDLLEQMHPTPAVGGYPKRAAVSWIAANEPQWRGWYTGTVGWLDAHGDATFVVAIRCGLITNEHAFIFTGAGIVADSDPAAEYAETELKQLPLLRALGVTKT